MVYGSEIGCVTSSTRKILWCGSGMSLNIIVVANNINIAFHVTQASTLLLDHE